MLVIILSQSEAPPIFISELSSSVSFSGTPSEAWPGLSFLSDSTSSPVDSEDEPSQLSVNQDKISGGSFLQSVNF